MSRKRRTTGPDAGALVPRRDGLIVLDVDEVVLHFIAPFRALLAEHGAGLHPESFRLNGNVRSVATGAAVSGPALDEITARLYAEQEARQRPVEGAAAALARLAACADIVFLTAMTPAFYPERRRLLDGSGLPYPMIATERTKGAVVAELAERWTGPVIFADDLPPNLVSVARSVPRVRLLHLMADDAFRPHLPPLPPGAIPLRDWAEAERVIAGILGEHGA